MNQKLKLRCKFFSGKEFLFSDDWREDIARLEERLSQLEEELNQRFRPQRRFNNVGYQQRYGPPQRAPPRTGITQLNRNSRNPLLSNQFGAIGSYENNPFGNIVPQRSPNSYDNRVHVPPSLSIPSQTSISLPSPNNPGKKPSSNSKKQRGHGLMNESSHSLPQPAPIPNPPSISQPIAADPKSRNTDELTYVRSSKLSNNQK